ncbi:hypothetical protein OpiT1DRAFT_02072 [Opitutaceae bacterium TAV1]|nr:hypothetical protein OpiT1DRAFT_02072 [Opitutaceae bacterium TAV1]
MSTQEFYIRQPSEEEARGPYTLEQMTSLAENGEVTRETLYYEAATEQWVATGDNPDLAEILYPSKKVLRVKKKEKIQSLNEADLTTKPITVQQMLAAAEGRVEEGASTLPPPEVAQARATMIGRIGAIAMLAVTAIGFTAYSGGALLKGDFAALATKPLGYFAAADLILAILLACRLNFAHGLTRLRAALFVGFIGFFYFATLGTAGIPAIALGTLSALALIVAVSWQHILGVLVTGVAGLVVTIIFVIRIFH